MKTLTLKYLPSLTFFYRYLRYRLALLLIVSILVGLLDGLGLAMFLPLLEFVADSGKQATNESMGNLAFLLDGIRALGLELIPALLGILGILGFFTSRHEKISMVLLNAVKAIRQNENLQSSI